MVLLLFRLLLLKAPTHVSFFGFFHTITINERLIHFLRGAFSLLRHFIIRYRFSYCVKDRQSCGRWGYHMEELQYCARHTHFILVCGVDVKD